jgi:hypothetical protein
MGDLILVSIAPLIEVKNHTSNGRKIKKYSSKYKNKNVKMERKEHAGRKMENERMQG